MKTISAFLLVCCASLYFSGFLFAADAPIDWDAPAFSLAPESIARDCAAASGNEGDIVLVLYEKDSYRFDERGAAVHRFHIAYKVLNQKGCDNWNTASAGFQPWRQEKPEIRARVIDPRGTVSLLDPGTISDATDRDAGNDIYTDSRILDAPLPNLVIGSVVEYEIVTRDKAPLLDKGSLFRIWFSHGSTIQRRILEIDAPTALPLSFLTYGPAEFKTVKGTAAGRASLCIEASNIAPVREVESFLPSTEHPYPLVEFTTGSSWADIARSYAASVAPILKSTVPAAYVLADRKDRRVAIETLLFRMQKDVRYTGINFGQNSIIPHAPSDTITRGYGDCKDQAGLLVTILERNGIPARMALLLTGPDIDVPATLPGFGMFDHAIVYLPEDKLWIDPTATLCALGVIPTADQGRMALVIDPATRELSRIPELGPADNRYTESVDVNLAEYGPAKLTERTTLTGTMELSYRQHYNRAEKKSMKEQLESYVKGRYNAKSLGAFSTTDPTDMATPFCLTVEAVDADIGMADESSAVMKLRCNSLFSYLPDFIKEEDEKFKREHVMELQVPFHIEVNYTVHPSVGFRAAALPANVDEKWGPCAFKVDYALLSDGAVTARFTFDSVQRSFTAVETKALYDALQTFYKSDLYTVSFEQIGESFLSAGEYKEAMAEFSKLAALHPAEAYHHIQLSRTLLAAGFAAAAEKEARAAVALEAGSARAWDNLGWVLLHDPFGRMFEKGCDLPGALKAYAEAERLDPKNADYPYNQAIILEYGKDLTRYSEGAQLDLAVKAYRRSIDINKSDKALGNTAVDFFKLGDYASLKSISKDAIDYQLMQTYYLATVAYTDGAPAAQKEAARIIRDSGTRRSVLQESGQVLMNNRSYPQAAALILENARGAKSQTQAIALANMLKNLKPFTLEGLSPSKRPVDLCKALFGYICSGKASDMDKALALLSRSSYTSDEDWKKAGESALELLSNSFRNRDQPLEVVGDLLLNMMVMTEARTGGAMAVVIDVPQIENFERQVFYMHEEKGELRIVALSRSLEGLGSEVWNLLEQGKIDEARDWWNLLSGQGKAWPAFPSLAESPCLKRAQGEAGDETEKLRTFAAFMLCTSDRKDLARTGASYLLARFTAEQDPDRKASLAMAVMFGGETGELPEAVLAAAKFLSDKTPDDLVSAGRYLSNLDKLGRQAEADQFLSERIAKDAFTWADTKAQRLLHAHRINEAIDAYQGALTGGKPATGIYNNLLWFSLFTDYVPTWMPKDDVFVKRLMEGSAGELQTLVCYLAKEKRILEAREAFEKYLSKLVAGKVTSDTWVAFGLLAESFELKGTAIEAYHRCLELNEDAGRAGSSTELAKRRLAGMGSS